MAARRTRRDHGEADAVKSAAETEKHVDATDEEQSSDDEAPEEVSAAAATALAGSRRKAEHLARQAAPKRKRARTSSSKGGKNAPNGEADGSGGGGGVEVGSGHNAGELGLPSELLLKVKSGGLQRIEADVLAAKELEKRQSGKTGSSTAIVGVRKADLPRSDNFRLVVLGGDDELVGGVDSKTQASENAKKFLRGRMGKQKRVSHALFKARKRLGPSPNF